MVTEQEKGKLGHQATQHCATAHRQSIRRSVTAVRYTSLMTFDGYRWGNTQLHLPADLQREETKARIESHVKDLLGQTEEWPIVLDVPHGGREITENTRLWLIKYRTGPEGQTTRWLSAPAQLHRKAK